MKKLSIFNSINIIKKYKWTYLSFLVLIIYSYNFNISKLHLLGQIAIIFLPLLLFSRVRPFSIFIALILAIVISIEYAYFLNFGERVSPVILGSASEVTFNMGSKVAMPLLKFLIPLIIFNSFLMIKVTKELKTLTIKKIFLSIAMCLLVIVIPFLLVIYKYYNGHPNKILVIQQLRNTPFEYLKDAVYIRYPLVIGDILYLVVNSIELSAVKDNSHHANLYTGLSFDKEKNTPIKIIIIVGESSISTHYPLYGYPYDTTPFLSDLNNNGQLLVINNAIAGAPITRDSLRLAFSFASPLEGKPFFENKNLVEMGRLANYETLWLSSTIENGLNAKYSGMIAHSSDIFMDANTQKDLRKTEDLGLIPFFKKYYQANKKQLFILHLLGSHLPYNDRYDKRAKALITTDEYTEYDRSTYNTNLFIQQVVEEVNRHNENTLVIYFSDHGEIINKGHGFIYASSDQYKIPFILYAASHQKNQKQYIYYSNLINKYRSPEGIFNLASFSFILAEILGYEVTPELVEKARKEAAYIYHSDGKPYFYQDIDSGKMPNKPN